MYEYIKSLLKFDIFNKGEKNLINNFTSILSGGNYLELEKTLKDSKIAKIIINNDLFWNNINIIVQIAKNEGSVVNYIKILYGYNKDYILKNKYKLFDIYPKEALEYIIFLNSINIDLNEIIKYLDEKDIKINLNELAKYIFTLNDGKKIIIKNYDYFIKNNHRLLDFRTMLNSHFINSDIDEIIDNNIEYVIEEMINNRTNLSLEDLKKENLLNKLVDLINSILKSENKKYHDLIKIGVGDFSDVYKVGNKVIKIRKEKVASDLKDNKLILKPIYSADIKSGINKKQLLNIEINDFIDTKNISIENIYYLYKTLRKLGYIWIDCRLDNVGRLINLRKIILEDGKEEVLQKGELVILDDDYIYKEEKFKNMDKRSNAKLNNVYNFDTIKSLENRYQLEENIQTKII